MVDVGSKPETRRMAKASAVVTMDPETFSAISKQEITKGDVLGISRMAGVMASKQTANLIPLCHPLRISSVDIDFEKRAPDQILVTATVTAMDRTGVEMEAMTCASVAALTIYDMCKSRDRSMSIECLQLEEKLGGKSGHFMRGQSPDA